jgi:hypothetical protein
MTQRGRSGPLSVIHGAGPLTKIEAPRELTEAQGVVWRQVIGSKPTEWFDEGNIRLLLAYCKHAVEFERISQVVNEFKCEWLLDDEGVKRYEKLAKLQALHGGQILALSRSMRLAQQSQYDTQKASVASRKVTKARPWETPDED